VTVHDALLFDATLVLQAQADRGNAGTSGSRQRQTVLVDSRGLRYGNDGLRIALQTRRQKARQAACSWDAAQLLATAEADIIDYLVATYSVEHPVLHPELAVHAPVSEVIQGRVTIVTAVPFDGDREILDLCLSRPFFGRPAAQVGRGELRLRWAGRIQASAEPAGIQAKVRRYFDSQLGRVEKCLTLCRGDIDWHNAWLRKLVSSVIAERKAGLMADRRLEASLGFPAPPRAEATEFAVPVARRKIETLRRPAASAPSQPEWVLPEAQYEQALAVLRNARNALERGPAMTAYLAEEKIRDLLLVFLNAQFEGAAAGEVFNAAGKTDILIRAEDRNVFIAECKIWNGPATIRDALGQLLSYLTWRDTKAALLVFIRHGEPPTEVISKAVKEIEGHPNYKRTFATGEDGERYNFIVHAAGDPDREIRLAFLPFALQDRDDARQRRAASAKDAKHPRRRASASTRPRDFGSAGS
jgi:hypothetical protein